MQQPVEEKNNFRPEDFPVVLFDSYCLICEGFIQFLLRTDRQGILKYAALDSEKSKAEIRKRSIPIPQAGSVILLEEENYFLESEAILHILKLTDRHRSLRKLARLFPRFFRDGIYRFIARNRYRVFKSKKSCPLPDPELRSRFV